MRQVDDEPRSWERTRNPESEAEKVRDPLEALRQELRRRSDAARLYRSLSRNYPDRL
jgi:hypothetical protein